MVKKNSNNCHRELKLLRFRRAGRKIIGWLKDKRLILQILRPDIERMVFNQVQKLIYESSLPRPRIDPIQAPNAIGLQLHFKNELPSELFTSTGIEPIDVVVRRGNSEEVELTGPFSSIMVEMVVLNGEFVREDWTEKEFNDNIVEAREGKAQLLIGKTVIVLKDGIGTFANMKVTDNTRWTKCGFRLGVRVVQSSGVQGRIREAKSKAFLVKDIRGRSSKKHDSPLPMDEIWRLKNIRKSGVYFEKLTDIGIKTVQDFLRLSNTDPDSLQSIMPKKKLEETLIHAKQCTIDKKYHIYSSSEVFMLLLNSIYEVVGVKFCGCQSFQELDDLSPSWKYKVEILKQKAYKNKDKIEEYNEEPLFDPSKPQEIASIPETSSVNLPNPQAITHPKELASPSFSHPTNVAPQSMTIPPQENGDLFGAMDNNSSIVPTVSQQVVYDEGLLQDFQLSPLTSATFNHSNTSGVTEFSNLPFEDHKNCWAANGSPDIFVNANNFVDEIINFDWHPDSVIQIDHASFHELVPSASFHELVPSTSFQFSGDFTGGALNWPVLKVILRWRMQMKRKQKMRMKRKQMKKNVAYKKTDKIE